MNFQPTTVAIMPSLSSSYPLFFALQTTMNVYNLPITAAVTPPVLISQEVLYANVKMATTATDTIVKVNCAEFLKFYPTLFLPLVLT